MLATRYVISMKDHSIPSLYSHWLLCLLIGIAILQTGHASTLTNLTPDPALKQQRHLFNDAREAIKKGQINRTNKIAKKLQNYPLYPYLRYWQLYRKKSSIKASEMKHFKNLYGDIFLANRLEHHWLTNIAKQGQWRKLLKHYQPSSNTELNCHYRRALYKNNQHDQALSNMEQLWLVGKSQPRACDPLFSAWQDTPSFTEELAWQRLKLSMEAGQIYLVRYLERFVSSKHQLQSEFWRQLHRQPEKIISNKQLQADNEWNRFLLLYSTKRLARYHSSKAAAFWNKIAPRYDFTKEKIQSMEKHITLRLAKQGKVEAMTWLTNLDDNSHEVNEWRMLIAIKEEQWGDVLFWYNQMPTDQKRKSRWQYWHARALEQLNFTRPASSIFKLLSQERSYYGFLAASRSQQEFKLENNPLDFSSEQLETISQKPGIIRAREFYALGDKLNARREWYQAMKAMPREQQLMAAQIAHQWGWHDRVINTLGNAKYWDDIELRFPLAHNKTITQQAKQQQVDPAWAYAIIRQESAFTADARSPKGALGLMQIMPNTGKYIAKILDTNLSSNHQLIDIGTNIRFGISYLNTVMNRFDQNTIVATAAYNAGSTRVKSWLPSGNDQESDQWVELIPYKETRNYVKNVMAYTIIYNQRLGHARHTVFKKNPTVKGKTNKTGAHPS